MIEVFFMLLLIFGISVGSVIGFTSIGLIGGLIGILLFNRKIVKFPNPKIAIFIGYVAFLIIFFLLPFVLSMPSYGYSSVIPFFLLLLSIPFIHCVVTIGFFILLQNRNAFNSIYFAYVTAYFLASLVLAPFILLTGLFGLFGGYGTTVIDPLSAVTGLLVK